MFELDICICASKECPRYSKCLRGAGIKRAGIYTMSYLGEHCNESSDFEAFIPCEEEGGNTNGR